MPSNNKERDRAWHRAFYHNHIIAERKRSNNYYHKNKDKIYPKHKERKHLQRRKVLNLLGGKCVECGFSDWRGLCIDHINGGGSKERKQFRSYEAYETYVIKQIEAGSKDYQCLCATCNQIKKYERGEFGKPKTND